MAGFVSLPVVFVLAFLAGIFFFWLHVYNKMKFCVFSLPGEKFTTVSLWNSPFAPLKDMWQFY